MWTRLAEWWSGGPDSSHWLAAEAYIFGVSVEFKDRGIGVELAYGYHADGEEWSGRCWIPFADEESAQVYAASRPGLSRIQIRYCPGDCGRSVMLEKDQANANPLAVWAQSEF